MWITKWFKKKENKQTLKSVCYDRMKLDAEYQSLLSQLKPRVIDYDKDDEKILTNLLLMIGVIVSKTSSEIGDTLANNNEGIVINEICNETHYHTLKLTMSRIIMKEAGFV